MNEPRYLLVTFGCQMNKLDQELLDADFQRRGWRPAASEEKADIVLFLTCSVRQKPEEKVFARISQIRKRDGRPLVCLAGCTAQRLGAEAARREPSIDLVLGTGQIRNAADLLARLAEGAPAPLVALRREPSLPPRHPARRPRKHQAFVAVARGCSRRCAYCVVPETRGPQRSRDIHDVVNEAASLVEDGVKEITLIAQSISAYGKDLEEPRSLPDLLEAVHGLPGLRRLRFLTSHPGDLDLPTLEAMARLDKVCPHLHLPPQSGSDRVLRAMGRGYDRARYLGIVLEARKRVPDVEFTGDFIVGFPGETEEDFEQTVSLVEEVRFLNLFAFQYSPRPNTCAERLPDDVPPAVKKRRNHRLLDAQEACAADHQRAWIGRETEILVEGPSKRDATKLAGRTPGNRNVVIPRPGEETLDGEILRVRVESCTPLTLFAKPLPRPPQM